MTLTWIVLLPFLGALLPGLLIRAGRYAGALTTGAVTLLAFILLLTQAPAVFAGEVIQARWEWLPALGLNVTFFLDGLGFFFAGLILGIGLLIAVLLGKMLAMNLSQEVGFLGGSVRHFDYTWLKRGLETLSTEIERRGEDKVVVVISTVLPGTMRREIKPLLGARTKLCYNPFFIAMGTAMQDFLHPEFVLFGVDDDRAARTAERFYRTITHAPFYKTTIENAELIKVVYNTFLSTKLAFVNTVMEACHQLPNTNIDDVMNALKLGNVRIISDKYLSGGMGDGGGCHPRESPAAGRPPCISCRHEPVDYNSRARHCG